MIWGSICLLGWLCRGKNQQYNDVHKENTATDAMFSELEENVDSLRREIYRDHEPVIRELPALDITEEEDIVLATIPHSGSVEKPLLLQARVSWRLVKVLRSGGRP